MQFLQLYTYFSLDDIDEFLSLQMPASELHASELQDLPISIENMLNEGSAYTAAEFFLGNTAENLLTTPKTTPSFNGTMGFNGAEFYSQGPFSSPIIDPQSLAVNKPLNDSSSGLIEYSNVGNEMLTAAFGNFVSQPDNMDIVSRRLPDMPNFAMAEEQSLYTFGFNTQFLTD